MNIRPIPDLRRRGKPGIPGAGWLRRLGDVLEFNLDAQYGHHRFAGRRRTESLDPVHRRRAQADEWRSRRASCFPRPGASISLTLSGGTTATFLNGATIPAGPYEWVRLDDRSGARQFLHHRFDGNPARPSHSERRRKRVSSSSRALPCRRAASRTSPSISCCANPSSRRPGQAPDYMLKPVLRLVDNAQVGTITGTIQTAALGPPQTALRYACARDLRVHRRRPSRRTTSMCPDFAARSPDGPAAGHRHCGAQCEQPVCLYDRLHAGGHVHRRFQLRCRRPRRSMKRR